MQRCTLNTSPNTSILNQQPVATNSIQDSLITGNYKKARDEMKRVCLLPTIDATRAITLDKSPLNNMPCTVVRKQSSLPVLFSNFTKTHKRAKHISTDVHIDSTTEKDKLLN